jgi:hypothetical protein
MAVVGFHDVDYFSRLGQEPYMYNLDLMKLSTYYKNKRMFVIPIRNIPDTKCSIHYCFNEYSRNHVAPIADNVEFRGLVYDGEYIPMRPEIEMLTPDISVYETMDKDFIPSLLHPSTSSTLIRKSLRSAAHLRLSLDGQKVWQNWERAFSRTPHTKTVILHDPNIVAVEDSYKVVQRLFEDGGIKYLGSKYPIKISNKSDLEKWTQFKPSGNFSYFEFINIMPYINNIEYLPRESIYTFNVTPQTEYEFIGKYLPYVVCNLDYLKAINKKIYFNITGDVDIDLIKLCSEMQIFINGNGYKGIRFEKFLKRTEKTPGYDNKKIHKFWANEFLIKCKANYPSVYDMIKST